MQFHSLQRLPRGLQACPASPMKETAAPLTVRCSASYPRIDLIATDVDGTLLTHKQTLSPRVEAAIKMAADAGVPLIVATGKSRGPWVQEVFPRINMDMPGVFLQGLLVCDSEGCVLQERALEEEVALDIIHLAEAHGVTLTAYCGDRIIAKEINEQTDRLAFYKEPTVEAVGPLSGVVGKTAIQKMIFMAPQPQLDAMRGEVERVLHGRATLTVALEGMLEVLPLGASKGAGVAWLLQRLGVAPEHVMAMGDGENDIEMLQLAGLGVAMGNAGPKARAAADVVVASNDEDGVAEAIDRFVLQPRGLRLPPAPADLTGAARQ